MGWTEKGGDLMGLWLITSLGTSLILTIILEEIFAIMVGIRNKTNLLLICMVNVLTNPVVVFTYYILTYYTTFHSYIIIIPLELIAILVEFNYFKTYGKGFRHPFIFAICVNLFSFGIGKIIGIIF